MPYSPVDPSTLEGDALSRWYQRSPAEIEQERQAARVQQYNDFFGGLRTPQPLADNSTQSSQSNQPGDDLTPASPGPGTSGGPFGDAFLDTTPTGPIYGGLLATQPPTGDPTQSSQSNSLGGNMGPVTPGSGPSGPAYGDAYFDTTGAGQDDGGYLSLIGNPAHPRLRREWTNKTGLLWPWDPKTGRNQDVAHYVARADGGPDHVDNIRPMPHDEHVAEHMANDDFSRWGARSSLGRASAKVSSVLGPFSILSDILGMISGRIRTDTPDNMWSDLVGVPSREDQQKALEQQQKAINPNWKPGDPILYSL